MITNLETFDQKRGQKGIFELQTIFAMTCCCRLTYRFVFKHSIQFEIIPLTYFTKIDSTTKQKNKTKNTKKMRQINQIDEFLPN